MTDRLKREKELPAGYQFGDAGRPDALFKVDRIDGGQWAICACGIEMWDRAAIKAHRCGVTANVIEGDHHPWQDAYASVTFPKLSILRPLDEQ